MLLKDKIAHYKFCSTSSRKTKYFSLKKYLFIYLLTFYIFSFISNMNVFRY